MRQLENLQVWKDARVFAGEIYHLFLNNRDFGFKDQIQRASVSIMNNSAEGFDSGSDSLFIRYLNIVKGSCSEVKSMLYLCEDLKYCTPQRSSELRQELTQIHGQIYNLIKYLDKKN